MRNLEAASEKAFMWLENQSGDGFLNPAEHCPTRDLFQTRLDHMLNEMESLYPLLEDISLVVAVAGEIGNNSFDHNIGSWKDVKGIFFIYDLSEKFILIADRGQGVLATLKRVRPDLKTDEDALRIAFTERVSGRSPERRGNGLKFVEKVVRENNWKLYYYSGNGMRTVNKEVLEGTENRNLKGVLAILNFKK